MNNCREHFSTNQDVRIGITCYNISTPQKYWTCLYIIFQIDPTFYQFSQVSSNIPCWLLCLGSTKGGTFVSEQLFFFFFFFFERFYLFIFRERGREGEREWEVNVRETLIGCLSYAPRPRTKPTTQTCALTGNQTGDLWLSGTMPNQLRHTVRARQLSCKTWIMVVPWPGASDKPRAEPQGHSASSVGNKGHVACSEFKCNKKID